MQAKRLPLTDLENTVRRCEAAVLAGTSTHRDVLDLIDAEREIRRREGEREAGSGTSTRGTHVSRTGRSTSGGGTIRF